MRFRSPKPPVNTAHFQKLMPLCANLSGAPRFHAEMVHASIGERHGYFLHHRRHRMGGQLFDVIKIAQIFFHRFGNLFSVESKVVPLELRRPGRSYSFHFWDNRRYLVAMLEDCACSRS